MKLVLPTVDDLLASASKYAHSALDAHNSEDHEFLAIFAATAVEHITKACLIKRHPALLLDLRASEGWATLLFLVGEPKGKLNKLHTVGLRESLIRVKDLFDSKANQSDLLQIIDVRDGVIHIAENPVMEERLLIAFLRQIDASLDYLSVEREQFWGTHLRVVEAMLSDESNRVKKHVGLKDSTKSIEIRAKMAGHVDEVKKAIMEGELWPRNGEEVSVCPACGSNGIAVGKHEDESDFEVQDDGTFYGGGSIFFNPSSFSCKVCGLNLASKEELVEAGMKLSWKSDLEWGGLYDLNHYWEEE